MSNKKKRSLADPYESIEEVDNNEKIEEKKEEITLNEVNDVEEINEVNEVKKVTDNKQTVSNINEKKLIDETHTRATFLIKKELLAKIDRLTYGKRKGYKTMLINNIFEKYLHDYEKDK
jgi:hypothetical protein